VHVNEDFTQPAVRVLAGPEIDLVASDPRLLGIAAAPRRQALAVVRDVAARFDGLSAGLWTRRRIDDMEVSAIAAISLSSPFSASGFGAFRGAVMSRSIFMDLWSFHGFDVLRAGESDPAGRVEC